MKVSLPNGVRVAPMILMPALWARTAICAARRSSARPVTSSSGLAQRLRRSLVPSMTMACVTPGCASTSRSKRRRPLSPRISCRMRLPPSPLFMTPIGRPPRGAQAAGQLVGPAAEGVDRRDVAVGQRVAERDDAARLGRRQHIDAAQEEPLVGQIADRHHRLGREIAGRRDVVGLPRIAAGDREIRQHLARQMKADREIGERRDLQLDRIAEQHRAGGDRRRRRCRRSSACGREPATIAGPLSRNAIWAAPIVSGRVP